MSNLPAAADFSKALTVITLIAQGRVRTQALLLSGMTEDQFTRTVERDATGTLAQMHDVAVERGFDALADILLHINTDTVYGSTNPQMAKVISENIKWYLSKKNPKKFGDKVTVDVTVSADREIINALKAAQEQAARGGYALPPPAIEDAQVIDVTPPRVAGTTVARTVERTTSVTNTHHNARPLTPEELAALSALY